jgi:hypothetical protein
MCHPERSEGGNTQHGLIRFAQDDTQWNIVHPRLTAFTALPPGGGYVLNVWAGRRTAGMRAMDVMAAVMLVVGRLRGGVEATMARAGVEMPRA